jgi:hypothetical protein
MTIKLRRYRRQSEVAPVMSTSNSASFDAEDRANRDSQPLRRTKIRYSSRTETNVIMPKALATACWHPTRSSLLDIRFGRPHLDPPRPKPRWHAPVMNHAFHCHPS